jgi:hypothetical protein
MTASPIDKSAKPHSAYNRPDRAEDDVTKFPQKMRRLNPLYPE